ncbi:MAG: universal stress protein [Salinivirgaceae bacterium]|jgi:nucleotide-binding universal stress UspA family protein
MDTATNHLLVPVDFSDKAVFGLQMAAKMLNLLGGKVTVINVLKGVDPIYSDFFEDEERELLLNKLRLHLRRFSEKYIDTSRFELNCVIEKGKRCETILSKADEIQASFIVMGTSTIDNIKKWIIGTNALRVVTEANCPVITLKEAPTNDKIERIILPMDITKEGREKVVSAVHWAKALNAEIHVVSAYTLDDDSIFARLQTQQKQVVNFIEERGVKCVSKLFKVDDRVDALLEYIENNKGDLVVITTHEQLEIVKFFMGSFAKSIMRGSKVPVISMVPKIKHHLVFKMPAT